MQDDQKLSPIVKMGYSVIALVLFMIFYPSISAFMSGVGAGLFSGLN